MKIGYIRTSTNDQSTALQEDALKSAGCERIFVDEGISGGIDPMKRPAFAEAYQVMDENTIFCVWKLDRLGRSLSSVIATIDDLKIKGVQFVSVSDNIDTTTAMGRAFWQISGVFAELERNLIQERTIAGLEAARKRGKILGRPHKLNREQVTHARREIDAERETIGGMAQILNVSRKTLGRAIKIR